MNEHHVVNEDGARLEDRAPYVAKRGPSSPGTRGRITHPSMKTAANASRYEMRPVPWKPTTEYVNWGERHAGAPRSLATA